MHKLNLAQKSLSCLLVLCLTTALFPVTSAFALEIRHTPNTSFKQTEVVPNSFKAPEAADEVLLREPLPKADATDASDIDGTEVFHDKNSITYKTGEGQYTTRFYSDPLTYTDGQGKERDIDNTLVAEGDSYTNAANAYSVTLPREGDGLTIDNKGYTLALTPLFGRLENAVVLDNAIRYNNIADGVDLQYSVFGSSLKEDIILNHPSDTASFSYELAAEGITFVLEDNVVAGYELSALREGRPHEGAEPVFALKAPLMSDNSGEVSERIALSLDTTDGTAIVTITPDATWLAAPERAWPVLIDPSYPLTDSQITYGTIQAYGDDTYRTSSGPNTPHDAGYLYVGVEDGSLISTYNGYNDIMYGQSKAFVRIDNITAFLNTYFSALPSVAIVSAKLSAYRYKGDSSSRRVSAAMITGDWGGNGAYTWNNRPTFTRLSNSQDVSVNNTWVTWDISTAFINWRANPATNRGIMLDPDTENQAAVAFSGPDNIYGNQQLYFELSWTVPNAVDENLPLNAPNINLRPLTTKTVAGLQKVTAVFVDGQVRPTLAVNYRLATGAATAESGTYTAADYGKIFPDSDVFGTEVPYTLGWINLYESNWQTRLFKTFVPNTIYNVAATATNGTATTPEGTSDPFIIYEFKDADTLPYVANYYGVTVGQLEADNRPQDHLAFPGNTFFIRNPNANATIPYTRPDNPTLAQKRALIYASMGRSMSSEYDMEPVDMATGNFYMESTDAQSTDYTTTFEFTRSYNARGPKTAGVFGTGWSFAYGETLTGGADGSFTYHRGDGKQLVFAKDGTGYRSPVGYNLDLTLNAALKPEDTTYSITDASGTVRRFNSYGLLVTITSARGETTTVAYDTNYRINSLTTPAGKIYSVTTNAAGKITKVTLPNGGILTYGYTGDNLTSFTNADGATVTYTYNAQGLMSEWADGRGITQAQNVYDAQDRVIKQIDAAGGISTVVYTETDSTLTDATGNITTYTFDERYRVTEREGARPSEERVFDADDQLIRSTDAEGTATTYTYDAAGNIIREERADGTYQELAYNAQNKLTSLRDFAGNLTTKDYDTQGNLTKTTYADNTTNTYTHDTHGRVTSITDGEGNTTTFVYNGTASMVTTDAAGNATTCYYDAMGNLINEVDAHGVEHKTLYSPGGRQTGTWITGGIQTQNLFDAAGNCTARIDEEGNRTDFVFDAQNNLTQATDPTGAAMHWTYDARGNRLSQTDAEGNTTTYTYDAQGNLSSVVDADGNTESYAYDGQGRIVSHTDARGAVTRTDYDAVLGLATHITSPSGIEVLTYDALGNTTSHTATDGTTTHFTYDSRGRVSTETTPAGLICTYSYDANGNLLSTADSEGRTETYSYDATGNLTGVIDALGNATAYTYDATGRRTSVTLANGATTAYSYDNVGNLTSIVHPDNTSETYTYDKRGNLTSATDALGATTTHIYDARGDLAATIDALGGTTTYAYDANQRLIDTVGELSQHTGYSYDALGRPVVLTDALGNTSEIAYDAGGNAIKLVAADGSIKRNDYDSAGRITKTTDAVGYEVTYTYDAQGRVEAWEDNAGNSLTYTYDSAGRVTTETDAAGRVATYEYDRYNNTTKTSDLNGDTTTYTFDALDRCVTQTAQDGRTTTFTYDAIGNLATETDAEGYATTYSYDVLGRPISTTDAAGQLTEYAYDATGNLTSTTYADGSTTEATYDALRRQVSTTDANNNTTEYTYDASSQMVATRFANGTQVEYAYDAQGNLTAHKDEEGFVTTRAYDALGRLVRETSPLGATYSYTYDAQGNTLTRTDPLGAVSTSTYTPDGKLETKTAPNGLVTAYTYDEAGRVTKLEDSAGAHFEVGYDPYGNIIHEQSATGALYTYTYDEMHRITSTTNPEGALTQNTYDSRGNLVEATLPAGGTYTYGYDVLDRLITGAKSLTAPVDFTYDELGRITSTVQKDKISTSTYDGVGNVVERTDALGRSTQVAYDTRNRAVALTDAKGNISQVAYSPTGRITEQVDRLGNTEQLTWDADGNLIEAADALDQITGYAYDAAGNLTRLTEPSGRTAEFTYDAQGNMVKRTTAGASTTLTYDAHDNLLSVTSPSGKVERFEYDVASRLVTSIRPDGGRIEYDYDKLDSLINKRYSTEESDVTYGYDTAGNRLSMDDATGKSTYSYDVAGRLASYTDAQSRTLAYTYDEYGRMASVTYADGRTVAYGYDLADNLASVTDSKNGTTRYTYDANDNVTSATRPGGLNTTYTYDAGDNLLTLTNTKANTTLSAFTYTYDALGRIVTEDALQDGTTTSRAFTYDTSDQLATITETTAGATTTTTYTYDLSGNRIATVKGTDSYALIYHYDADGQLTASYDGQTDTTTVYAYDANGNLISKDDGAEATTYTYDIENRLRAVRAGGELLMAASYDGDDNRTFSASKIRVPVSYTYEGEPEVNATEGAPEKTDVGKPTAPTPSPAPDKPATSSTEPESPAQQDITPAADTNLFWFGFGSGIIEFFGLIAAPAVPTLQQWFAGLWTEGADEGSQGTDTQGSTNHDNLADAGLTPDEIARVLSPATAPVPPDEPPLDVVIPVYTDSYTKTDYELTYYLNDISMQNVQVAQEYDGQGSLTDSYTYGTQRLSSDSAQGTTDTYLYDGRGSVAQTHNGATTTHSLTYDAFGGVKGGVEPYEVLYAFNGEEYSDTTQLQYLRARYYAPELAAFISKDSELGVRGRINSFNRFAFAEGDPVNNFDPTGHAIGNTTYERQMEAAGGINELYNFYVGNTLQASLNRAQAGFNAQLNYAKGVDYTSARAINSIVGISQETANAYILNGALGALSVGLNYGCMPGALVASAIGTYVRDVNTAKDTTNTQIAIVKDNKVAQYNQYQAYLAWLREQARLQALRDAMTRSVSETNLPRTLQTPTLKKPRTALDNVTNKVKTTLSKVTKSLSGSLAKPIASSKSVNQNRLSASSPLDRAKLSLDVLGFGTEFIYDVTAVGMKYVGESIELGQAAGVLDRIRGVGAVGSFASIGITAVEIYNNGGSFSNAYWDLTVIGISSIPYAGPYIGLVLGMGDLASGGKLSSDYNSYYNSPEYLDYITSPYYFPMY